MLVKHKIWHKSDNELLRHSFMLVSDTIDRSMPKLKYVSIQSLSSFLKQLQGNQLGQIPKLVNLNTASWTTSFGRWISIAARRVQFHHKTVYRKRICHLRQLWTAKEADASIVTIRGLPLQKYTQWISFSRVYSWTKNQNWRKRCICALYECFEVSALLWGEPSTWVRSRWSETMYNGHSHLNTGVEWILIWSVQYV